MCVENYRRVQFIHLEKYLSDADPYQLSCNDLRLPAPVSTIRRNLISRHEATYCDVSTSHGLEYLTRSVTPELVPWAPYSRGYNEVTVSRKEQCRGSRRIYEKGGQHGLNGQYVSIVKASGEDGHLL